MPNDDGQVADQPVEPTQTPAEPAPEPAPKTEPEQPAEPQAEPVEPSQEPQATPNEGAEAPPADDTPLPEEEPFDPLASYPQFQQDLELPADPNGIVDPVQFAAQLERRFDEKLRFNAQETRAWQAIDKKYPGLSNDDRRLILDQRIAAAVQGKDGDLVKIADGLMGRLGVAKSQGRADATTSRKVQKAAGLEKTTSNTGGSDPKDDRLDRIADGDKAAADDLMSDWLAAGKV